MRLTKKRAIDLTIELWEWLAETGKERGGWGGWDKYGEHAWNCFLCKYDSRKRTNICNSCPYYIMFGSCSKLGTPYQKWHSEVVTTTRKKYAKLFLEQMHEVRDENR